MWMDGDLYRAKQPRPRPHPERDLTHLITSLDDVSLSSSSLNAKSIDEIDLMDNNMGLTQGDRLRALKSRRSLRSPSALGLRPIPGTIPPSKSSKAAPPFSGNPVTRRLARMPSSAGNMKSFTPGLARSLGNLYSLDHFVDDDEDDDTTALSYPSLHPSLLSSSPPPQRFGFGYPVPSFQQEVNNNLNNSPAPAHRPAMRGNFRPSNPRGPVPVVLTGRHLSRSIPSLQSEYVKY